MMFVFMMKRNILFSLIILGALLFGGASRMMAAKEIVYSRGDSVIAFGTNSTKAETYDVSQHIVDPALVGMKIKAIRVTFPFSSGLSSGKVWLSQVLPVIKSQRMQTPDIATQEFTPKKGSTEVAFAEPYTITESGVYVGYSVKVEAGSPAKKPIVLSRQVSSEGFLLHSSDVFRTAWHDLSAEEGSLALQVVLEGDQILDFAAGVGKVVEIKGRTGQTNTIKAEIINHGAQGVQSFDYTYTIAGQEGSQHVDLGANSLPGIFGRSTSFEVVLPAVAEKGAFPVVIDITKVNGVDNVDPAHQGKGLANLYHTLPKHRAVLEEYTGTWCGYCPRGFVGLEEMNRLHPDDFIGISYHNRDPMEIMSTSQYPNNVSGFPAAFLDRVTPVDAFSGNGSGKTWGIETAWELYCNIMAPAEVDVFSQWTEDSLLTATACVSFPVEREDCPYEVGFVLLSDGLKGTSGNWRQANYYTGESGWPSSMDEFVNGGSYVSGLTFNFVIIDRSGVSGIENSLQAPIVADLPQSVSYQFDIRQIRNTSGEKIVQDKNNLVVVALLFDKNTDSILNANKARVGQASSTAVGQPEVESVRSVVKSELYDLNGHHVVHPRHGIYVRVNTLSDGTMIKSKVQY